MISEAAAGAGAAISDLFNRRNYAVAPRQADTLLPEVLGRFNLSLTQQTPIQADFNLEIVTGEQAIEVDLGTIPLTGFPSLPVRTINFGFFELGFVLTPLALASMISIQPNMTVVLPFGADISFERPLQISGNGIEDAGPDVNVRLGDPIINAVDPSLCISAALGPVMKLTLGIPSAGFAINLEAKLELPRVSMCFDEDNSKFCVSTCWYG